ncbi:TatD family hydrolase [bacterium]|nr:TatD family hydrolase [bacterium]
MRLIDTHAHLNFNDFNADLDLVIKRAKESGVEKIVVPSANEKTSRKAVALTQKYQEIYASIGAHPLYLAGGGSLFVENGSPKGFYLKNYGQRLNVFRLQDFKKLLRQKKVVAIGEVGLDYFASKQRPTQINPELQIEILKRIFTLALEEQKPLILHIRPSKNSNDAFLDLINLSQEISPLPKAVVHCYSGNWDIAEQLIALGYYLSFTYLTFYSKEAQEAFQKIPLERVMMETDAPFLSPKPEEKRNEPCFLPLIVQKLSELRGEEAEKIAEITTNNAISFFNLNR